MHKKDRHTTHINDYQPISLSWNLWKIFAKAIGSGIKSQLEINQPVEKVGFRKGSATTNHLHTINMIIEKQKQYRKNTHSAFIDYKKSF